MLGNALFGHLLSFETSTISHVCLYPMLHTLVIREELISVHASVQLKHDEELNLYDYLKRKYCLDLLAIFFVHTLDTLWHTQEKSKDLK